MTFAESVVEEAALAWLEGLGYQVLRGPDLAVGQPAAERSDPGYRDVLLEGRLRSALARLNPDVPAEALEDAFRKLTRAEAPSLVERNRAVHQMLVDDVTVEYRRADGSIAGAQARVIDFDTPEHNDWLAVNQFTVAEGQHTRRPDVVLFVNGLPLAVVKLKNPADESATIWSAFHQLETYQAQIPSLFAYNAALIISDGVQARIGSLGAGREWFKPWRTIGGEALAPSFLLEMQVPVEGALDKRRFLDLLRYFVVFEDLGGGRLSKKLAGYHQFHAVNVAVEETLRAARAAAALRVAESPGRYQAGQWPGADPGDRRVGVVWHTQGSGKSLTMAFYAGRVILHPAMANPTIVVLTDRNDLDDQLFGTFARCQDLLRQPPVQAENRADLRQKLSAGSGGVVFTTIQKFLPNAGADDLAGAEAVGDGPGVDEVRAAPRGRPRDGRPRGTGGQARGPAPTVSRAGRVLSERRNIVVIADEAHRSQYDFVDGFASHMRDALPHASFIGFTGTPIEQADANTRAVFGDYISVYDIQRAVQDGATVPIYYESRLARLALDEAEWPKIDPDFEEATEGEEVERKERLKSKWAQLEAVVGSEHRVRLVARDLVEHFEDRLATMDGKAMVVCMSRRICVELERQIVALRPEWRHDDDGQGTLKVVMTGSAADPVEWQPHIRNKARREALAQRFRDPADPFRLVIVRDMWLTGFDAPSLHTMYLDKPMRGHGLMQAIARVNRVFKDKPGGLVVDYLGLGFFQAVRAVLAKGAPGERRTEEELDHAIRQIVSKAVASEGIVDIFAAAGLKKPDISILSDEFLAEVRGMPRRNLAVELLRKLLAGEIRTRSRRNLVQARSFAALLEQAVRKYQNRAIETAQVIEELIALAREMRAANARGEALGLTEEELAFYDVLETNDSAVEVLGESTLTAIAREVAQAVRANAKIDWTLRENVRAQLRVIVKRILRRYGYPPDKQEKATRTVLEQAELFAEAWAA